MEIDMHKVERIEISRSYQSNGNMRTIRIVTKDGTLSLTLYGNTDALEVVPKASDYSDYDKVALECQPEPGGPDYDENGQFIGQPKHENGWTP